MPDRPEPADRRRIGTLDTLAVVGVAGAWLALIGQAILAADHVTAADVAAFVMARVYLFLGSLLS